MSFYVVVSGWIPSYHNLYNGSFQTSVVLIRERILQTQTFSILQLPV